MHPDDLTYDDERPVIMPPERVWPTDDQVRENHRKLNNVDNPDERDREAADEGATPGDAEPESEAADAEQASGRSPVDMLRELLGNVGEAFEVTVSGGDYDGPPAHSVPAARVRTFVVPGLRVEQRAGAAELTPTFVLVVDKVGEGLTHYVEHRWLQLGEEIGASSVIISADEIALP